MVPPHPTYDNDVHPFLADHCLGCHSSPPANGAPNIFRLDVYDDVGNVSGAASMSTIMLNDVEMTPPRMPLTGSVGPNGKQMLANWVADGAPR